MELINKLKAILNIAGEKIIMNLKAAEFKKGTAFLHPEGNNKLTYVVRNCSADLLINNGESISQEDVVLIEQKEKTPNKKSPNHQQQTPNSNDNTLPPKDFYPIFGENNYQKARITFTVFAHERDLINSMIKESGFNRTNYFIACFQNNQKKSVERSFYAECAKVKKFRKEMQKETE